MSLAEQDAGMAAASVFLNMVMFAIGCWRCIPHVRNPPPVVEQRLIWRDCETRNLRRGTFRRALRMEKHSFDNLANVVGPSVSADSAMAKLRGGPTTPELCVFCAVRHFAGGSCLDIVDICGVSVPSFCRVMWRTSRATSRCSALDIKWPKTLQDVFSGASGFVSVGTNGATNNCVGAVDGCLLRIATKSIKL